MKHHPNPSILFYIHHLHHHPTSYRIVPNSIRQPNEKTYIILKSLLSPSPTWIKIKREKLQINPQLVKLHKSKITLEAQFGLEKGSGEFGSLSEGVWRHFVITILFFFHPSHQPTECPGPCSFLNNQQSLPSSSSSLSLLVGKRNCHQSVLNLTVPDLTFTPLPARSLLQSQVPRAETREWAGEDPTESWLYFNKFFYYCTRQSKPVHFLYIFSTTIFVGHVSSPLLQFLFSSNNEPNQPKPTNSSIETQEISWPFHPFSQFIPKFPSSHPSIFYHLHHHHQSQLSSVSATMRR